MVHNNGRVSLIIVFFIILSISRGEVNNTGRPIANKANQNGSSDCEKYIKALMNGTATKCMEFLGKEINRRLHDPKEKDNKCLTSCFMGYKAAIDSITKGITDISAGHYTEAIEDVVAFSIAIAPCALCGSKITFVDPQFFKFQKWARRSVGHLLNKIKSCIKE